MNDIFFLDESSIKTKLKNVCDSDIIKILKKTANFTIDDFIALISEPAEKYLEELAQKALSIKIQRFGKTIKFYCPLYVSNKCINNCLYCGFKATNFARRKTLNFAEIESEALKIKEFGFDNILIVSGEQPDEITMDYLLKTIEILIKYFSYIGIEIYPLSESEYKALSNAGVDGLTLYQETY
ncbi:MAG TPA: 2-iminoacetate synthase ThiH, partial [bacterium]|nr:2-iminoacetate synthase ThiH [bacterium]